MKRIHMPLAPRRLFLGWLLVSLGAACSSTNPYGPNRKILQTAYDTIEKGELEKAVTKLEHLLANVPTSGKAFALQRFFAAHLLVTAHEEASIAGAFLTEPVASASSFSLEGGGKNAREVPSPTAHLVALTYHASLGRLSYDDALQAGSEKDGEKLLPPDLESLGVANAALNMHLSLLAVYARLHFQDKVEEILNGIPDLIGLEWCERTMDECRVAPAVRPWVYLAVFDHLKTRDEPTAYKFGIRARETAADSGGTFDRGLSDRVARWITDESKYEFRSPANQLFDPALEACTVTGTPNIEYDAVLSER